MSEHTAEIESILVCYLLCLQQLSASMYQVVQVLYVQ